jgi:hypothetical protein
MSEEEIEDLLGRALLTITADLFAYKKLGADLKSNPGKFI